MELYKKRNAGLANF